MAADFDTAVRLLREEANAHRASCEVGERDWQCHDCTPERCPAKTRYEELRAAADALENGAQVSRLKRIPPLDELESSKTDEPMKEPA